MKCWDCGSTQDLMEYDQKDGVCNKCYQLQIKIMAEYKQNRTQKFPQIVKIQEGLYVGNEDAATSIHLLEQRNITAICVCGSHLDTPFKDNQKYAYKIFQIRDFPKQQIKQYFDENCEWMAQMQKEKRNILVHCAAGVSRSVSFMVAFLMKGHKMPYHEALKRVKEGRKQANPNSGFRKQLIEYSKQLGHPTPPPQYLPFY